MQYPINSNFNQKSEFQIKQSYGDKYTPYITPKISKRDFHCKRWIDPLTVTCSSQATPHPPRENNIALKPSIKNGLSTSSDFSQTPILSTNVTHELKDYKSLKTPSTIATVTSLPSVPAQKLKPMKLQFYRTKICPWVVASGHCRRDATCRYAHCIEQLRPLPDLSRTKICEKYIKTGKCPNIFECKYAHSYEELRATQSFSKTKICPAWLEGSCHLGDTCRFAHGENEIRTHYFLSGLKLPSGKNDDMADENQSNCTIDLYNDSQSKLNQTPPIQPKYHLKYEDTYLSDVPKPYKKNSPSSHLSSSQQISDKLPFLSGESQYYLDRTGNSSIYTSPEKTTNCNTQPPTQDQMYNNYIYLTPQPWNSTNDIGNYEYVDYGVPSPYHYEDNLLGNCLDQNQVVTNLLPSGIFTPINNKHAYKSSHQHIKKEYYQNTPQTKQVKSQYMQSIIPGSPNNQYKCSIPILKDPSSALMETPQPYSSQYHTIHTISPSNDIPKVCEESLQQSSPCKLVSSPLYVTTAIPIYTTPPHYIFSSGTSSGTPNPLQYSNDILTLSPTIFQRQPQIVTSHTPIRHIIPNEKYISTQISTYTNDQNSLNLSNHLNHEEDKSTGHLFQSPLNERVPKDISLIKSLNLEDIPSYQSLEENEKLTSTHRTSTQFEQMYISQSSITPKSIYEPSSNKNSDIVDDESSDKPTSSRTLRFPLY